MKTPPISRLEVMIQGRRPYHFVGPQRRLKPLLGVLRAFDFRPRRRPRRSAEVMVPWREALAVKEALRRYGEPGAVLRGARLKEGLNQQALAKKVGTTQGNISQMEAGSRPIGKQMAKRLGAALRINYRVFL